MMRQLTLKQWIGAVALATAGTTGSALSTLACAMHEGGSATSANSAKGGATVTIAHAGHNHGKKAPQGDACEHKSDDKNQKCEHENAKAGHDKCEHEATSAKNGAGDACCNGGEGSGKSGEACHHGGQMGEAKKSHAPHGYRLFRRVPKMAEVRYMPASATGSPNQYVVLAGGLQHPGDGFTVAWQHNLALQLNPAAGNGPWIAPYAGLMPRYGFSIAGLRLDAGVLGGLGVMGRTVTTPVIPGANLLDARLHWVLEPRVEVGFKRDDVSTALVGTYLMTPNSQEFGGMSVGLKVTFKSLAW